MMFSLSKKSKNKPPEQPEDIFDIKEIASGENPIVDIVAVHGLNGHRDQTWTHENGSNWLQDFLPTDIPDARILAYGYNAFTSGSYATSSLTLSSHGKSLVQALYRYRSDSDTEEYRPIVFVAHDVGGLVVKHALIYSNSASSDHLKKLKAIKLSAYGVLFFGTPHSGQNGTDLSNALTRITSPFSNLNDNITKHLSFDSEYLNNLGQQYLPISSAFKTIFFYEALKTSISGHNVVIVPHSSAVIPGARDTLDVAVNKDHVNMVKYDSARDSDYQRVLSYINDMVKNAQRRCDSHVVEADTHSRDANSSVNAAGHDINFTVTISAEEKEILAALKPVDRAGYTHGCMEGTRKDTLQQIDRWLNDYNAPNVLLLTGSPGSGKTTIAASVTESLGMQQRLGSSFIFKHSDTILSDPGAVWRTAAWDLARFHSGIKDYLVDVLKGVDPGRTANISLQFRQLIEEPLKRNDAELLQKPPVIVLDALDECDGDRSRSDQRERFLGTLEQWFILPRHFKLIITSRDERIPESFRDACTNISLMTGSDGSTESTDDIRHFLWTRFSGLSERYPSLSNWPGEPIIEKLTKQAAGLFIWADTLVRFVDTDGSFPEEQLDLVLAGVFVEDGDGISTLYHRILDISFGHVKGRTLDIFHAIVATIVLAKVPLFRDELAHFLPTPVKESIIDGVLGKLSSVISVGKADRIINICHLSFVDFICNPARSHRHSIDRLAHSRDLASTCFRVMKADLKFNICHLETSHLQNRHVEDLEGRIQKYIPTHLAYACRFGWRHLRDAPYEESTCCQLLSDVDNFLHVRLLYWLEVMSLIGEVALARTILHSMSSWIGTSNADLAAFAKDAAKFTANFSEPIAMSAPHIYLSALPWSPQYSKVAQHFLPHFTRTFSIFNGQERNWPALANVIEGHTYDVVSVKFSPDGKFIASGSWDDTICIWDAQTGEGVAGPFKGHTDAVSTVAFSPDGKYIVSGSYDKTVRVWDTQTGETVVGPFKGHTSYVNSVVFSPDGNRIASGSDDNTIRVWDSKTGMIIGSPLEGHTNLVMSVAFSANGERIISGSRDGTMCIWDTNTCKIIAGPFQTWMKGLISVVLSPGGNHVLCYCIDGQFGIWNATSGETVAGPFASHLFWPVSAALSPDRSRVALGLDDGVVHIFDAKMGEAIIGPLQGHNGGVNSVAFSPDGKSVVSGSDDMTVCIWDVDIEETAAGGAESRTNVVNSVAFSPNGQHIASGSSVHTIQVWNAHTGAPVTSPFQGHTRSVESVAFSPNGERIVSGADDEMIRIWDAKTGEAVVDPVVGHSSYVGSVVFSPNGTSIASGSEDCTVRVWDAETGESIAGPFEGHREEVYSVAFSPDGKRIASGSGDKTVRIWDTKTGDVAAGPFEGHDGTVWSVAFSPDGKYVASGSGDNTVRVWDAVTGETAANPFNGHSDSVRSVVFSPAGGCIVSGSTDNTVRVWDAKTGGTIAGPFEGHTDIIYSVAFSPEGERIVSGSEDKTIRIWDAEIDKAAVGPSDSYTEQIASGRIFSGKDAVSASDDRATRHLLDHHFGMLRRCHFDHKSGWMKTEDGNGLLHWVPTRHRGAVCGPDNILIIGKAMVRLDLRSFVHGTNWTKCHTPCGVQGMARPVPDLQTGDQNNAFESQEVCSRPAATSGVGASDGRHISSDTALVRIPSAQAEEHNETMAHWQPTGKPPIMERRTLIFALFSFCLSAVYLIMYW